MTKRQVKLGVTEYGIQRGVRDGEFMVCMECFLAKISTVKKGQYYGKDLVEIFFGSFLSQWHADIKPFLFGLTASMPNHFHYSDTHGLDILTIK